MPTFPEIAITVGIWAFGLLVFTLLAKGSIPIKLCHVQHPKVVQREPHPETPAASAADIQTA